MDLLIFLSKAVLAAFTMGLITRTTRSNLLDVMSTDYIRTARAKGLSNVRLIIHHALGNALIPVLTVIGLGFGIWHLHLAVWYFGIFETIQLAGSSLYFFFRGLLAMSFFLNLCFLSRWLISLFSNTLAFHFMSWPFLTESQVLIQ